MDGVKINHLCINLNIEGRLKNKSIFACRDRFLHTQQNNICCATFRHTEGVFHGVAIAFPSREYFPVSCLDGSLCMLKALVRQRTEHNVAEAGCFFVDSNAANNTIQPVTHRTVGVVIKGIHVGAPHRAVGLQAVPMLPYGCRSLLDGIEPRRVFFL